MLFVHLPVLILQHNEMHKVNILACVWELSLPVLSLDIGNSYRRFSDFHENILENVSVKATFKFPTLKGY